MRVVDYVQRNAGPCPYKFQHFQNLVPVITWIGGPPNGALQKVVMMQALTTYVYSDHAFLGRSNTYELAFFSSRSTHLLATSTSSSSYNKSYDPFDSIYVRLLPYLSAALILTALLWRIVSPIYHNWLPVLVSDGIKILKPFITEDDLKLSRGQEHDSFLRRGAVQPGDSDSREYGNEGFLAQSKKNLLICLLSLCEQVAWTVVIGYEISSGHLSWAIDSKGLHSICALMTWVSMISDCASGLMC
jgi:hypothetical protein